jgi:hypothetical protein
LVGRAEATVEIGLHENPGNEETPYYVTQSNLQKSQVAAVSDPWKTYESQCRGFGSDY